jgi:hypothetical protein
MPENYESRPERPCMGCGKRDRAPRDQVTLPDGNVAYYHWDCHILIANCQVCKAALEALGTDEGNKGLKDEKLVAVYFEKVEDKPFDERPEIFRTEAAVPQQLPNN